ncbi:hypothetical protein SUDANB105_04199 [Streptomyces sp. enrichment culture]
MATEIVGSDGELRAGMALEADIRDGVPVFRAAGKPA